MGLPLGLLMLFLATVGYSGFSYNTTQITDSTLTVTSASNERIDLDPEYICAEPPPDGPDNRPSAFNCALCIRRLPNEGTEELFHIGGDAGIYRLPRTVTAFDCRLAVDIHKFFLADMSTWRGVREAATNLTYACQSRDYSFRTGGWTMTGRLGRINISLVEPVRPPWVQKFGDNSTIGLEGSLSDGSATE